MIVGRDKFVNNNYMSTIKLLSRKQAAIIGLSIVGGLFAVLIMPRLTEWIPYDYSVYVKGARLVREGQNPHALLSYWYPLPVVLFTTLPMSFLPNEFAWAFALIPLGLLHLHYGRQTVKWWLFYPLLINVAYGQAEGWILLLLVWLLEDKSPAKSSLAIWALMFKPAYGVFLIPYRLWGWLRARQYRSFAWLSGVMLFAMGAATLVEPTWLFQMISGVLRRHDHAVLLERNMTIWAFFQQGGWWLAVLPLFLLPLIYLSWRLFQFPAARAELMLAWSLFFFPDGLNPVSSMMIMPLVREKSHITILVVFSWLVMGLDNLVNGFGGVYLLIVLMALWLRLRSLLTNHSEISEVQAGISNSTQVSRSKAV